MRLKLSYYINSVTIEISYPKNEKINIRILRHPGDARRPPQNSHATNFQKVLQQNCASGYVARQYHLMLLPRQDIRLIIPICQWLHHVPVHQ